MDRVRIASLELRHRATDEVVANDNSTKGDSSTAGYEIRKLSPLGSPTIFCEQKESS